MSQWANYAGGPRFSVVQISSGNANWDGTGTITELFKAGYKGSRVDDIGWTAIGNSTYGFIKFFYRASSGDTWRYAFNLPIPVQTLDTTGAVGPYQFGVNGLGIILSASAQIGVATHTSGTFNVQVTNAGDF